MKNQKAKSVFKFTNPVDYFIHWRDKHPLISYQDMEELTNLSKTFFYKVYSRKKDITPNTAVLFGLIMGLKGKELQYFIMMSLTYRIVLKKDLRAGLLNPFRPKKKRR